VSTFGHCLPDSSDHNIFSRTEQHQAEENKALLRWPMAREMLLLKETSEELDENAIA
jgi:hypothetical protein